jgi:hypothetical protein
MKIKYLIILLIQFLILKVEFCQINPLKFEVIVASELDSNLTTMLEWHIKKTEKKHKFTKNNIYTIAILPKLSPGMGIPKQIIDSIYLRNVFPIQIDSPEYHVSIETEDKRNPYVRGTASFKNKYYFNYFGKDVFVISDLNIEIKNWALQDLEWKQA